MILIRLFILFGSILCSLMYFSVRWGAFGSLPSRSDLKAIESFSSSEIYASGGELLGKYFIFDHSHASLDEISPNLLHALLATEDVRFYKHRGTDYRSLMRVLVKNLILGQENAGGGSTITHQLAKNLFPRSDGSTLALFIDKMQEAIIAGRMERTYTKDEILILYLNTVSFGENVFGVGSASQRFFNKKPADLNIQEAATLVGMLKASNTYNPRLFPERSVSRRNTVIDQLANYGFISPHVADSLKMLPLLLNYNPLTHALGPAPYFREMLRMELRQWLMQYNELYGTSYNLYQDGLKIYTTLDFNLQQIAEQVIKDQMKRLQGIVDNHYKKAMISEVQGLVNRQIRQSNMYRGLVISGLSEEEIAAMLNQQVEMQLFNWNGDNPVYISPMDSAFHAQKILHNGLLSIDPATGHVKAWVGGNDIRFFQFDHVMAPRQVGSAFKPFVYAAAIEKGINPCEFVSNDQFVLQAYDNWSPSNHDDRYGGYYTMRGALSQSVNVVTARYLIQTGAGTVVSLAHEAGMTGYLPEVPSLALGTAEISLFEMTAAYAIFPNQGRAVSPQWLLRIEDQDGNLMYEAPGSPPGKQVVKPETALLMTEMLEGVIDSGTARSLRWRDGLTFDIAGKTGTTQFNSDGWFIGYTPELVTGIWVGLQNPAFNVVYPLPVGSSGSTVPMWGAFMKQVAANPLTSHYTQRHFEELPDDLKNKLNCEMYVDALPRQPILKRLFGSLDEIGKTVEPIASKEDQSDENQKREGLLKRILKEIF